MSGHKSQQLAPSRLRQLLLQHSPILSSLLIHAMVLLLAFTTYTVGKQVVARTQEQAIVPDAVIVQGVEVGAIPKPSLGADPTRAAAGADAPDAASEAWKKPSRGLQAAVMNPPGNVNSTIGAGNNSREGAGPGLLGADGASAAPFGAPAPVAATAPKTMFMGVSGNAKKIIYVCDASGSMVGTRIVKLKAKLAESVNQLIPVQGFSVILFKDERPTVFSNELLAANAVSRQKFKAFLDGFDVHRGGDSDPRPALRLAFLQHPDLIYFLTDGDFVLRGKNINAPVIEEIRWLNREKHVRINTIAVSDEDSDSDYLKTLKTIAADSGGTFAIAPSAQQASR